MPNRGWIEEEKEGVRGREEGEDKVGKRKRVRRRKENEKVALRDPGATLGRKAFPSCKRAQ